MRSIRSLRRIIHDETGRSLRQAEVKAVHGDTIDVRVGGSPKFLRGLSVIGGVDNVVAGDTVLLLEADGRIYAETTKAKASQRYGNKSGVSVAAVLGPHTHLGAGEGAVLDSYVRVDDADTITAQHSFSPAGAQAPFLLGGHAQSQVVVGFRADELDKDIVAGDGLSGGGTLTANCTLAVDLVDAWAGLEISAAELRVDLDAEFAWTDDHAWDTDTLFVDVSEDSVYINSGVLPTTRGALTIQPAADTQRGLVLKRPWSAANYNANLLAIIDENDDHLIILSKQGDLESGNPGFVSGASGWQITHDGNAEFNNIVARGEFRASVFVIGEMHASGGTLMVLEASKVVEDGTLRNLCTNPSFESGVLNWFVSNAVLTQDAGEHQVGSYSGKVVSSGQAFIWPSTAHLTVEDGESISVQAQVKSACDGSIHVYQSQVLLFTVERTLIEDGSEIIGVLDGGGSKASSAWSANGAAWQAVDVSWTNETGARVNNITIVLEFDSAETSYVDAVKIERVAAPTGYTDGDTANWQWLGTVHESTSAKPYLHVEDPLSGHNQLFDVGDLLRVKVYTGHTPHVLVDNWFEVLSATDPGGGEEYWEYGVELKSGSRPENIPAGSAIVNYGQSGAGYIKLTSDESYAPFMDIATHAGSPWDTITTHVRVGNLDGVLGLSAEWGMAAGTDLSDVTLPHIIMSDQQVGLFGVTQSWWNDGGTVVGQVIPTAAGAEVMFWLGASAADKRFQVTADGDVTIAGEGSGITNITGGNIQTGTVTATQITGTTLSAIYADMGTLTAGSINIVGIGGRIILNSAGMALLDGGENVRAQMSTNDGTFTFTSAEAGNARIEIDSDEIVGYDGADVKQFYLEASTGKAFAGAGAVWMDSGGLYLDQSAGGAADQGYLHFVYSGSDAALVHGYIDGTGNHLVILAEDPDDAADQGTIFIIANDSTGAAAAKVYLYSKKTGTGGNISMAAEGPLDMVIYSDYVKMLNDLRVVGGLYVGGDVNPVVDGDIRAATDFRCAGGLSLGTLAVNPGVGTIYFNSGVYHLRRNGIHIEWWNGSGYIQLD